jgi:hypothetical protein
MQPLLDDAQAISYILTILEFMHENRAWSSFDFHAPDSSGTDFGFS